METGVNTVDASVQLVAWAETFQTRSRRSDIDARFLGLDVFSPVRLGRSCVAIGQTTGPATGSEITLNHDDTHDLPSPNPRWGGFCQ